MSVPKKRLPAVFYQSPAGVEPVRDWLLGLDDADRRRIGEDIRFIEYRWPVGMPHCRSLGKELWEVRTNLSHRRIARVMFANLKGKMVLLHGFLKKTQKTPKADLDLARKRKQELE